MSDPAEKFSPQYSVASQCLYCRHLSAESGTTCDAFPDGIPEEILTNTFDHREPVKGDHGIHFDPREDVAEPILEALYRELDATDQETE